MNAGSSQMLELYFVGDKVLEITDSSAILKEMDGQGGVTSQVNVVVTAGSANALSRRRAQMMESRLDKDHPQYDESLLHRCSVTTGVCYHTWEEMVALSKPTAEELKERAASNRRLISESDNVVTYGVIRADTAVLTADSYSDLSQATTFLEGVLGAAELDSLNGTFVVSFTMKERCTNYNQLVSKCSSAPAPDLTMATSEPGNLTDIMAPYPGLTPEQNKWIFSDEIEYSQDPYTIMLKVRYSHDPLKAFRRHVVMMDITNAKSPISYEEVLMTENPDDLTVSLITPTLYMTNYQVLQSVDDEEAMGIISRERRQLRPEEMFERHARRFLAGFPSIRLPEEVWRRRLSTDDDDSLPVDITVEAQTTASGVVPLVRLTNLTTAAAAGMISDVEQFEVTFKGAATALPASTSTSVSMVEATSTFDDFMTASQEGLIQWPAASAFKNIPTFSDCPIVDRSQLEAIQEASTARANSTRRSLHAVDHPLRPVHKATHDRVIGQLEKVVEHLDYMHDLLDRTAHRRRRSLRTVSSSNPMKWTNAMDSTLALIKNEVSESPLYFESETLTKCVGEGPRDLLRQEQRLHRGGGFPRRHWRGCQ